MQSKSSIDQSSIRQLNALNRMESSVKKVEEASLLREFFTNPVNRAAFGLILTGSVAWLNEIVTCQAEEDRSAMLTQRYPVYSDCTWGNTLSHPIVFGSFIVGQSVLALSAAQLLNPFQHR